MDLEHVGTGQPGSTADSADGYISDVAYTLGFHRELAPTFLDHVCLTTGIEPPSGAKRRLRYCELGCGRGFQTVLLAAANPDVEFVGIDFNSEHIAEATDMAGRAAIANVRFIEAGFDEAGTDAELGLFDYIVLHGVYAWVAPPVRDDIRAFIRARLHPGGVVHVSYNTHPGWTRAIPTQKLLIEAAKRAEGDSLARLDKAMQVLRMLAEEPSGQVERRGAISRSSVRDLAKKDRRYLAHEYLSAAWQPLFVTDVIAAMASAGLDYAGSASLAENRLEFCAPPKLAAIMKSAPDEAMRELIKDIAIGQAFRRDVYVRQPRRLDLQDKRNRLLAQDYAAYPHTKAIPEKLRAPAGEIGLGHDLSEAVWRCIDGRIVSGAGLVSAGRSVGEREERMLAVIELLVHNGVLHPARPGIVEANRGPSQRFNEAIFELSKAGDTHRYLASPVLGTGFTTKYPERILPPLIAATPLADDRAVAEAAFDQVLAAGQHFLRDGISVDKDEDSLGELSRFVGEFRAHRLPRWQLLGTMSGAAAAD
ncbi:methyltransferase domain-containing protein [Aquibium carbonis]|uniref:Methyltransferase domain-containing protein n=1 Tax=Aquibium carbonis TaxID=2495581 RepID=A0A3S0AAP0_9HYPH|nr:class I SAM-dependent methyltransferase [Aquibium carbonis]RST87430.1 methyltransferase domain-containing protein [Aquibium carbonis]